jgi:hypothetical protein
MELSMDTQLEPRAPTRDVDRAFGHFYLNRLERLVALHPTPGLPFDAERLLHHAIYATFVDCRNLGLEQEAHTLVARVNPTSPRG